MNRLDSEIKTYNNREEFAKSILYKNVSKAPINIVSDIGSGFGNMKNIVQDLGCKWQPFDYMKKIPESMIWDLNDKAPKEAEKAGMVLLLEVLEHLNNPFLGIQNISNHMEQGAFIILTTPNPQSSKNTLSLFLKGSLYAFQKKHIKENHVFTPWKHVVEHFLNTCGLELIEYAIVDIKYKTKKPTSIKDWLKQIIENIIEYRNPLARGMSYGIVAKKV
jgi:transposase